MTLSVNLAGMGRMQDALFRASTDAGLVERHIREQADLAPEAEGMIQTLMMLQERAYPWGQQAARQISKSLNSIADGVGGAMKLYRNTDHAAAAALDATYPPVALPDLLTRRPGVDPNFVGPVPIGIPPPATFSDVADPEHELTANLAFNHPDFKAKFNGLSDTLSPTAIVRSVIQAVFHKDILAFFLRDISGDWDALYNCGTQWFRAGNAIRQISSNTLSFAVHLPTVWTGNGADGCELYQLQVDTATFSRAARFDAVGQAFHDAAEGAWTQFDLAATILSDVLDDCVAIAAGIGGGAATSSTVIGPILGGGAAAFFVWRAWEGYKAFTEIMDATQKMLDRIRDTVDLVENVGKAMTANTPGVLPFPAAPYHLPGA